MTAPSAGHYGAPGGASSTYEPPTQGSKSRPALLVALALVAALVIGGGAWAVTRSLGGGGDQPASALPAETAAYLRVDIDPKIGQKIAAVRFFDGLDDEVLDTLKSEDIRKEFFDWMAQQEEAFASIDYEKDIEPWLGDRMAVGIIPNGSDEPYVGIALQVKDEDAANEGLTKVRDASGVSGAESSSMGWYFQGDYAVLTEDSTVQTLQDMSEAGTLADQDNFRDDMAALGDEGVMSVWADLEPLASLADTPLGEESLDAAAAADPVGVLGNLGATTQLAEEAATGRFAAAVRFSEDSIEVGGITRGVEGIGVEGGDSAHLILDLPEDTMAALSLEHGDQYAAALYEKLKAEFPEDFAEVESQATEAGFALPDDIQTLLGSSLVVSAGPGLLNLGDAQDLEAFEVAYRTETDTDAAHDLIGRVLAMTGDADMPQALEQRTEDGVLTLGVSPSYVEKVASDGGLGDSAMFKAAVPNAADAQSVFYLNVNSLEHLYASDMGDDEASKALKQLAAVGFSASSDKDGNGEFTLRFVADE